MYFILIKIMDSEDKINLNTKNNKGYTMKTLFEKDFGTGFAIKVYEGKANEHWYDLRHYSENGQPTRRGVRLRRNVIREIIDIFEELGGDIELELGDKK